MANPVIQFAAGAVRGATDGAIDRFLGIPFAAPPVGDRRFVAARRLIDERWCEKLTLDSITRACGINRAKLTRGFRAMFETAVADAIADLWLGGAGRMLRSTDLPVSSIGYKCGYLNNASFTRAFSHRDGVARPKRSASRCSTITTASRWPLPTATPTAHARKWTVISTPRSATCL